MGTWAPRKHTRDENVSHEDELNECPRSSSLAWPARGGGENAGIYFLQVISYSYSQWTLWWARLTFVGVPAEKNPVRLPRAFHSQNRGDIRRRG